LGERVWFDVETVRVPPPGIAWLAFTPRLMMAFWICTGSPTIVRIGAFSSVTTCTLRSMVRASMSMASWRLSCTSIGVDVILPLREKVSSLRVSSEAFSAVLMIMSA